jgi:ribonuclease HI
LTAIVRALEIAPRHRDVTIFTDSRYAIDCVTVWFIKWRRNNWHTADNKPVENKDLIESILVKIEERESLKVKTLFEWVKGHNRDPGNEAADRLAVKGAVRSAEEMNAASVVSAGDIPDGVVDDDL